MDDKLRHDDETVALLSSRVVVGYNCLHHATWRHVALLLSLLAPETMPAGVLRDLGTLRRRIANRLLVPLRCNRTRLSQAGAADGTFLVIALVKCEIRGR